MDFIYAQINEQGYCIGISSLSGEVVSDNLILIDEYDISYLNKKYDMEKKEWTDEYYVDEPLEVELSEHELITKETYETTSLSAEDNLLNMDLLVSIDNKLNLIMEHLGLFSIRINKGVKQND